MEKNARNEDATPTAYTEYPNDEGRAPQ